VKEVADERDVSLSSPSGGCGALSCGSRGAALGAEHKFDGVYSGKRVLTKGSCPAAVDDVSVTIHDETLTFTNSALKKFVMGFFVRQDGSFDQIDTDIDGDRVHIVGHVTGDVIEADVDNPPCEYHWHLKKE
jgi:hypothetical protein